MKDFLIGFLIAVIAAVVYAPYCSLLNLHGIANELKEIRKLLEKKDGE